LSFPKRLFVILKRLFSFLKRHFSFLKEALSVPGAFGKEGKMEIAKSKLQFFTIFLPEKFHNLMKYP